MRLFSLAKVFAIKYSLGQEDVLLSEPPVDLMKEIKSRIIEAYGLYVNGGDAIKHPYAVTAGGSILSNKLNVFKFLQQALAMDKFGEHTEAAAVVNGIVDSMSLLYKNVETLSAVEMFDELNKVLALFNGIGHVREFIQTVFKNPKINSTDLKNNLAVNFEQVIEKLSSMCFSCAAKLLPFQEKGSKLLGERIERQRGQLQVNDIVDFIRQHGEKYGIKDTNDWGKALKDDLQLKQKLTTVINSLNRGHKPRDAADVKAEIAVILEAYNLRHGGKNFDTEDEFAVPREVPKPEGENLKNLDPGLFSDLIEEEKQKKLLNKEIKAHKALDSLIKKYQHFALKG